MDDKKFYWIKLRTDFFNRSEIDFLLSQKNGCQYIVLYQMLCLNTANTDGRLESKMKEVIIPYDIDKIVRDTKYFDFDTVAVALDLYKRLGLIYETEDNILRISNFDDLVGSETKWAKYKRQARLENVQSMSNKSIEIENKRLENKIIENKNINKCVYKCHLNKTEKDSFCLECQKKNVCNNKTSESFLKVFGKTFEEQLDSKKEEIQLCDYDWFNESEDDNYY